MTTAQDPVTRLREACLLAGIEYHVAEAAIAAILDIKARRELEESIARLNELAKSLLPKNPL